MSNPKEDSDIASEGNPSNSSNKNSDEISFFEDEKIVSPKSAEMEPTGGDSNFEDYIRDPSSFGKEDDSKIVFPDNLRILRFGRDKVEAAEEGRLNVSTSKEMESVTATVLVEEEKETKDNENA